MSDESPDISQICHLSPAATLVLDLTGDQILCANPLARSLLGAPDLIGRRFSDLLDCDPGQMVVFADAVAHFGQHWTRSVALRRPDGAPLHTELRGRILPGARMWLTLLDLKEIEHHRQIEEAEAAQSSGLMGWSRARDFFRELERRNHLILDAAGEGIYGLDPEGRATFVNRAAQDMLGWTDADLIGQPLHDVIHYKHLSGARYHAQDCPIYHSFRSDKISRVDDEVFWRKDGRPIRVEFVTTPIYDRGTLAGAVVIFRDVTERKENEQRLQTALREVQALRDRLELENAYLQSEISSERSHHSVIGASDAAQRIRAQIALVAGSRAHVLITGEPGTGKTLVASEIHKASAQSRRALIKVDCAGLSPEDVEAELFGHIRNARPGAVRDRVGKLAMADGGTLFLHEVGAVPLAIQGKLMATLRDGSFERPGSAQPRKIDLRVLASSSKDLQAEVAAGRFRQDLYYHLNVFPIHCPPLRDRPEDIALLAQHFLSYLGARHPRPPPHPVLSQANVQDLTAWSWPGNARELRATIERALVGARGRKLYLDIHRATGTAAEGPGAGLMTEREIQALADQNLLAQLRAAGGRVAGPDGAAARMGLPVTTLHSRLTKLRRAGYRID